MTPPATATASPTVRRAPSAHPASRPAGRPEAPRAPLRVVGPEPRRRARGRRATELLALAIVVGALLAVVGAHAMLAVGQVRLGAIETKLSAEQARHRQEVAAVAALETPSRIVSQSEQTLHMAHPDQVQQLPSVPLSTALPAPKVSAPTTTPSAPGATTPATSTPTTSTPATTPTTTAAGAAG